MKKKLESREGINGFKSRYCTSARIRDYYCPNCDMLLEVVRKEQIVHSASEEAKDFDFTLGGGDVTSIMYGNIRFRWDVFYCSKCNIEMPVGIIVRYNRERRKSIKKARRKQKMLSR